MISLRKEFKEHVLLGSGGQGAVYRAREVALDRQVALKSLRYANSEEKREILEQARRLSALSLDGVPRILRFFCQRGSVWLVMEYVEGISMAPAQCRKWPDPLRIYVALRIAEALDGIHQGGWAHGDLKPSNVLLTSKGTVSLIDMGFARRTDESLAKGPAGTLAYMAPEVKLNAVHDPRRADVYSFGVLFHEMLYGAFPDERRTTGFFEGCGDGALPRIIERCIDVNPRNRFESALALKKELADAQPLDEHGMQPLLIETVEPLLRERMHRCCLQSAVECKEDAYHLVCEALDWAPESSEALSMLQKVRPSSGGPSAALTFAVACGIAALGIIIFSDTTARALHAPLLSTAVYTGGKEYLEPLRRLRPTAFSAAAPLRAGGDEKGFRALIDVRDIPAGTMLFLDDSLLINKGFTGRFEVTAGDHVLYAKNSFGVIWRQHVEVAPFETLRLRVGAAGQ